jgi:hypothetical protein
MAINSAYKASLKLLYVVLSHWARKHFSAILSPYETLLPKKEKNTY